MQEKEKIFSEIVKANHGAVYRICLAYLYDKSYAADLYQEILVQVWNSLHTYRGDALISTWIYRIAINTAITYNASQKRTRHEPLPDTIIIADDSAGAREQEVRYEQLAYAISLLDAPERLLVSLLLEGLPYKDIAEITGNTVNNTGVRIARVKAKLMKIINREEEL